MRGFTLIETIIYLALLSVLIVGAVASLVSIETSTNTDTRVQVATQEAAFVEAKIIWALGQAYAVATPVGEGGMLTLRMHDASLDPIVVSLKEGAVVMREGSGKDAPLTSANVSAQTLSFTAISHGVRVLLVLDNQAVNFDEYLP